MAVGRRRGPVAASLPIVQRQIQNPGFCDVKIFSIPVGGFFFGAPEAIIDGE